MTTLQNVADELNASVGILACSRLNSFTDFHRQVGELIQPVLTQYGLRKWYWEIRVADHDSELAYIDLIKMGLPGFVEDKRYTRSRRGRIGTVHFALAEGVNGNVSIERALDELRLRMLKKAVTHSAEYIDELKKQLADASDVLAGYVKQVAGLEYELGEQTEPVKEGKDGSTSAV